MTTNVTSSGAEDRLAHSAAAHGTKPLWSSRGEWQVNDHAEVPHAWRWEELRGDLSLAAEVVPMEMAERRALLFCNPGLGGLPFMTGTMLGAYQITRPGERCPVHSHTASASRFLLEGEGGYTNVNGEKCVLSRGDLVMTPRGTFHDHGNDGDQDVVWVDILDMPLAITLNSNTFSNEYVEAPEGGGDPVPARFQREHVASGYSTRVYGTGGLRPRFVNDERGASSPQFVYEWAQTEERLNALRDFDGDPHDGILLEFVNPISGESAMPTLGFSMQLIRPGERLAPHRHSSSTTYVVLRGHGETELGGETLTWAENDVFVLPAWTEHAHRNGSASDDAILYSVSDRPALERLGWYREEAV
jgi:gentisate 1,2-dioxygenase